MAETDQIKATSHPITVQPKSRFRIEMDALLWCARQTTMIVGRK